MHNLQNVQKEVLLKASTGTGDTITKEKTI